MERRIPFSLTRGVGEDLFAPIASNELTQLVMYGKKLKGIRVQEETNLNGQPMYSFLSRKGMLKLGIVNNRVRGKLLMSGQSPRELKQDVLLRLFYAAVFCLRLSGTIYVSKDEKRHKFCIEYGEIYKETSDRRYPMKNPVWEQCLLYQRTKGQIHLLLERLGQAIEHQDRSLIEQYKIQLTELQKLSEELRLWDD